MTPDQTRIDLARVDLMVVNPARALQQILKEVLWDAGLRRLRGLPDGASALEAIRDHQPDLLFVDMALADGPGTALVRNLRRAPESPSPFVPVIMTMAAPTLEKTFAARDSGADEVVTRPITAKGVLQRVAAAQNRPRGIVLSPTFIGPDRRRAANMPPNGERRDPRRRNVLELAPMPLLSMAQKGERQAAEALVTEARRVLRGLRLAWIDQELEPVRRHLRGIATARELSAARSRLRSGLENAGAAMAEHGHSAAASVAGQLVQMLGRPVLTDRSAQLMKVNLDRLHGLLRAPPAEAERLAEEVAASLRGSGKAGGR